MQKLYDNLRSLLRGHTRRLAEYLAVTATLFVIGLVVIYTYVDQVGMDEKAARGATSLTMALLAFAGMLVIWRARRIPLVLSSGRWSTQRVLMSIIPQGLYLALVSLLGLSYLSAQLGVALVWGLCVALPLNYKLCNEWSLKETGKA